ncbi:hypothetical protein [Delftia sp. HK171]|uniref:hypothetical protein n=1 Tax=Delftia sp. HK171 TaxID=1920191 RepID=UPI0012EBDA8A|nr:hypothetical protein [Delftia sp. HK171]
MEKVSSKIIIPISDTQAAIGAGAIMSLFVVWALVAGLGDDFICWIGGKGNLSGWVQAIGSIGTIAVGVWAVQHQLREQRKDFRKIALENERTRIVKSSQFLLSYTADAMLICEKMLHLINQGDVNWTRLAELSGLLVKSLDNVSSGDLPSPAAGLLLTGIRSPIATVSIQCRWNLENSEKRKEKIKEVRDVVREVLRAASNGDAWLKQHILSNATEEELTYLRDALNTFKGELTKDGKSEVA